MRIPVSLIRGEFVATQAMLDVQRAPAVVVEGAPGETGSQGVQAIVDTLFRRTGRLGNLLMFFAGFTLHEALARILASWFVLGAHWRLRQMLELRAGDRTQQARARDSAGRVHPGCTPSRKTQAAV